MARGNEKADKIPLKPAHSLPKTVKSAKTCQNPPKLAKTRQNLPELAKTRQNPPELARTRQNSPKPALNLPKPARKWQNLLSLQNPGVSPRHLGPYKVQSTKYKYKVQSTKYKVKNLTFKKLYWNSVCVLTLEQ